MLLKICIVWDVGREMVESLHFTCTYCNASKYPSEISSYIELLFLSNELHCLSLLLSRNLAPVVRKTDSAIDRGQIAIQRICVNKTYCAIHRIVIYPLDSVIHPSNNRDEKFKFNLSQYGFFPHFCYTALQTVLHESASRSLLSL